MSLWPWLLCAQTVMITLTNVAKCQITVELVKNQHNQSGPRGLFRNGKVDNCLPHYNETIITTGRGPHPLTISISLTKTYHQEPVTWDVVYQKIGNKITLQPIINP